MLIKLFTGLFPKTFYTTLVVISLCFYSRTQSRSTFFTLLSAFFGFLFSILLHVLDRKTGIIQAHHVLVQSILSITTIILITSLGFKIMMIKGKTSSSLEEEYDLSLKASSHVKRQPSSSFDILLNGLPCIYIINQSLSVHIVQKSDFMTLIQVSLLLLISCIVLGLGYYAALLCYSQKIQKLSLTSLLYFMGALDMSKLFGIFQPTLVKNIVQLVRESHPSMTRYMMNAFMDTKDMTDWNGTGYSIYWIIIAFSIVYMHKK